MCQATQPDRRELDCACRRPTDGTPAAVSAGHPAASTRVRRLERTESTQRFDARSLALKSCSERMSAMRKPQLRGRTLDSASENDQAEQSGQRPQRWSAPEGHDGGSCTRLGYQRPRCAEVDLWRWAPAQRGSQRSGEDGQEENAGQGRPKRCLTRRTASGSPIVCTRQSVPQRARRTLVSSARRISCLRRHAIRRTVRDLDAGFAVDLVELDDDVEGLARLA